MSDGCEIQCGGKCCVVFPANNVSDETQELLGLIPLTTQQAVARMKKLGVPVPKKWYPLKHLELHMCPKLDDATGRCTIYADRPQMCFDYPYDGTCLHCGATATPEVIEKWKEIHANE